MHFCPEEVGEIRWHVKVDCHAKILEGRGAVLFYVTQFKYD